MNELFIKPELRRFVSCKAFAAEYNLRRGDLVITNECIWRPYFAPLKLECRAVYQERFGAGEPTDGMFDALCAELKPAYSRIFAVGGGTVIDTAKALSLKAPSPLARLYDGSAPIVRDKELIIAPATCGTGSEVTNIAIFTLTGAGTKKGLVHDALYADSAALIPELLSALPLPVFAASSIDALIHAAESSLSPRATASTRLFGYRAIGMILGGYRELAERGPERRAALMGDFQLAATYAGIAFANAGCAAVHALSFPLGAAYRVPHGESNYALFAGVMRNYMELKTDGEIAALNAFIAGILGCPVSAVYEELERLLASLIARKPLASYGMKEADIAVFADSVLANQQRLLANNFVFLDRARIMKIYRELL